ncbi:MAG: transposase [Patescibacteria group bacterium]
MPRPPRVDVGNHVYHVLNRAVARVTLFETEADYTLFESVLEEITSRTGIRLLTYCIMPNHFHLLLYPKNDGELSTFMHLLTLTHTQRWHAEKGTVGSGHLYQGRYKSFLVDTDRYFTSVFRYIEQNPIRAKLVKRPETWQWSGLYRRLYGSEKSKKLFSPLPVELPEDYLKSLTLPLSIVEIEQIRTSVNRGQPYGTDTWREKVTTAFKLESTFRKGGRPRKDRG